MQGFHIYLSVGTNEYREFYSYSGDFILFVYHLFLVSSKDSWGGAIETGGKYSIIKVIKSALFSKTHLAAYPILFLVLAIYFVPQLGRFKELAHIERDSRVDELFRAEKFLASFVDALKTANQLYLSVEDDGTHHETHDLLWKNLVNIKEVFVKSDFASNPASVENNFKIINWESERFIEGSDFEGITQIEIIGNKFSPLTFKLWMGSRIIAENESLSNHVEIYAKPPDRVDRLEISNNYGRKVNYERKGSINSEIVLLLKEEDFDDDHSSVITIVTKSKNVVPYSIYYEFTSRYKLGIDHLKLISHYRSQLKDYAVGWYNPAEGEIKWINKPDDIEVLESRGTWGIENPSTESIWTYSIELSSGLDQPFLFQYRQAWKRMASPDEDVSILK